MNDDDVDQVAAERQVWCHEALAWVWAAQTQGNRFQASLRASFEGSPTESHLERAARNTPVETDRHLLVLAVDHLWVCLVAARLPAGSLSGPQAAAVALLEAFHQLRNVLVHWDEQRAGHLGEGELKKSGVGLQRVWAGAEPRSITFTGGDVFVATGTATLRELGDALFVLEELLVDLTGVEHGQ